MKRFICLIITVLLYNFVIAQTATVTLVFTGKDSLQQYVQLDSVRIDNLTKSWSETIYYPDTTLILQSTSGIGEWESSSPLALSQNVPNPFHGHTQFSLSLQKTDRVHIRIFTLTGNVIAEYNETLPAGSHTFAVEMSAAQTAMLVVKCSNARATIKLINSGNASGNNIRYVGNNALTFTLKDELRGNCNQPFTLGDQMRYEGWATFNGLPVASTPIQQAQNGSAFLTLHFNTTEHTTDTTVVDTTVVDTTVVDTTIVDTTIIDPELVLEVLTDSVFQITTNSALCAGTVLSDGGSTIQQRGFCWSQSSQPTVADFTTSGNGGVGNYTRQLSLLSSNTTYYVRAYAINATDTAYGNVILFTTLEEPTPPAVGCPTSNTVTDNDGNVYPTVLLGNQCWMAKNLRTTTYADNTPIPISINVQSETLPYGYVPNNDATLLADYGYLYNWPAVTRGIAAEEFKLQGLCPAGWHVPTSAEWDTLFAYVSSQPEYWCSYSSSIGKALAATSGWLSSSYNCAIGNNLAANNATGFALLPTGLNHGYGQMYFGEETRLWAASSESATEANTVYANYSSGYVYGTVGIWQKHYGFAARCVYGDGGMLQLSTSAAVRDATNTAATCGGVVSADGGNSVTARGIVWSTSPMPTLANNLGFTSNGNGLGSFTSNISGLQPGTTYYIRAYATNQYGTVYGEQVTLVSVYDAQPCVGAPTVSDNDGNIYPTVQIGSQCWMAANLRCTSYPGGGNISYGGTAASSTTGYYYYVNGNSSLTSTYGLLYNWAAATNGAASSYSDPSGVQGICPSGWHLPSYAEYQNLHDYLESIDAYQCERPSYISAALASNSGWASWSVNCVPGNNPANNNASGFNAFPTGKFNAGSYEEFSEESYLWTATKYSANASAQRIDYMTWEPFVLSYSDQNGCAVRCVRD